MTPIPHRSFPCAECPWRLDTTPGQFPACRYDTLRVTSGSRGNEAHLAAPLFACHKSPEGSEQACAGWLATVGWEHLGVRVAVLTGQIPGEALAPRVGWPELHASYDEMVAAKAEQSTLHPVKNCNHG